MNAIVWTAMYRAALWCLPSELRRKHGAAMTEMFAAEVESADGAGATGRVVASALADVLLRGTYEWVRPTGVAADYSLDGDPMIMSTSQLLRRVWVPFVCVLFATTSLLVTQFVVKRTSLGSAAELAILAVPFTAAMTIPIAMFIALFWVSRRLRVEATSPVLRWSVVRSVALISGSVSLLAFALTAVVLPRSNARLQNVIAGHSVAPGDRSMTLSELQSAAQAARASQVSVTGLEARELAVKAASLELEFHKKFAISAAVLVLALVGLVLGWQFPQAGLLGTGIATIGVIGAYYFMLMGGESLADHLVVAPSIAIWSANLLAMVIVGAMALARRRPLASS